MQIISLAVGALAHLKVRRNYFKRGIYCAPRRVFFFFGTAKRRAFLGVYRGEASIMFFYSMPACPKDGRVLAGLLYCFSRLQCGGFRGKGNVSSFRLPWGFLTNVQATGGANNDHMWGLKAGRHGCRLQEKKTQTWTFVFFSTFLPTATAVGYTPPFEPLKDGFVNGTTVATTERREWREQTPPFCFGRGGIPAARGRDNVGHR